MPDFDTITPQCFCRPLWQATRQATKLYESVLGPSGLKIAEFAILSELSRGDGDGLSLPELASRFLLDRSALRYRLLPMVRAGLVEVVEDERDRRGRRVRITPDGQARFAAAQPLWHEAQSRFEKALGADEALGLRTRARAVGAAGFADSFAALG